MDDISQRTKTAGWKFGSSRATKKRRGRGRGAVTDSANDSSRSGPKFWKHSALPDGIRRSGRVSQYFLPVQNNAFHSLSKTYGVVLCSTWKRMINLEKLCLHLLWSRSVSVSIIREREIVGKRCIRRRRGEKTAWLIARFGGLDQRRRFAASSSRFLAIYFGIWESMDYQVEKRRSGSSEKRNLLSSQFLRM